ncbi:hypothetical protein AB0M91_01570 [Micromonospora rifamycinica]|uniref:hypothetical protein n=1 Tax=Micromonospora rifamycinica TaxID=291594 RepID=UPI00342A7368
MSIGSAREFSRYTSLLTRGVIRLKATTTSDLDRLPRYDVPVGVSPLDLLLADRLASESVGLPIAAPGAD